VTTGTFCNAANLTATDQFVFLTFTNQDAQLYGVDVSGHFPVARNTGFGSFTANGLLSYARGKTASGVEDDLYNIMPLNAKLSLTQIHKRWTNVAEVHLVDAKSDVSDIRNEIETPGYACCICAAATPGKGAARLRHRERFRPSLLLPARGAYVGQGITMPPNQTLAGVPAWGTAVPGIGRSIYAGLNVQF